MYFTQRGISVRFLRIICFEFFLLGFKMRQTSQSIENRDKLLLLHLSVRQRVTVLGLLLVSIFIDSPAIVIIYSWHGRKTQLQQIWGKIKLSVIWTGNKTLKIWIRWRQMSYPNMTYLSVYVILSLLPLGLKWLSS